MDTEAANKFAGPLKLKEGGVPEDGGLLFFIQTQIFLDLVFVRYRSGRQLRDLLWLHCNPDNKHWLFVKMVHH